MSDIGLAASPGSLPGRSHGHLADKARRALASTTLTDFCVGVSVAIVWALGHTLVGIEGDSRIYMGRALADLDPSGIGRDLMFAMDGQSSFTIFRVIARNLVAALGLGPTVALLSLVNLIVWFAAMATFVRAVAPGRVLALVLTVVCVLPRVYTPWNLLAAGEAIPVPRPLAEAGVLFAFAALCHGRYVAALACLAVAALFHPIMAAPGFGVLLILLGLRNWRWFAAAGVIGTGVFAAASLGVPHFSRLSVTIDRAWLDLLLQRNPYLFLHLWPRSGAGRIVVHIATIAIAASWLDRRARVIFYAAIVVALSGCVASYVLGDLAANLLVVQAQFWRALWLPAVLAPVAAGICLWRLPAAGTRGRMTLAALSLAWLTIDSFPLAPLVAVLASATFFGLPKLSLAFERRAVFLSWVCCAIFALASAYGSVSVLRIMTADGPARLAMTWQLVWPLLLPAVPIVLLVYVWWSFPGALSTRLSAPLAAVLGAAFLCCVWDARTPAHRDADAAAIKPDLVEMLRSRPGPVLWADGDDVWYWAGRPNWNGQTQGGGIVFSRDLGMRWQERARLMVDAGLATRFILNPWGYPISLKALALDSGKVKGFCRRPDAPAWIVASLEPNALPPDDLEARTWSPPQAHLKAFINGETVRWRHFDRYAVVPCAPLAR